MSLEVLNLLAAQSDIHGRISRAESNLKKMGAANITLCAVETRVALLDQLWARCEAQHEKLRDLYKEAFDASEYNTTQFFDSAEVAYVTQRSILNDYALRLRRGSTVSREGGSELCSKTSLPRLKIRSFSGAFED